MKTTFKTISTAVAMAALTAGSTLSLASDAIGPGDSDSRWVLGAAVGAYNNLYAGEGSGAFITPNIEYNGDTFFVKDGSLNLSFGQTGQLSGGLTVRFDGSFLSDEDNYDDNKYLVGLEERDHTIESGFYVNHTTDLGRLKFAFYTDLGSGHKGQDALLKYTFDFKAGDWYINPTVGIEWLSDDKVNHHFGVSASEAVPQSGVSYGQPRVVRAAYDGDAAFNVFAGIRGRYEFTDHLDLNLSSGVTRLGGSIRDSSIVEDDYVYYAAVGVNYNF